MKQSGSINSFPNPPKNPTEKPKELASQIDVIEGVLEKLKARMGVAANEDTFTGPISYLGYVPSPIIPLEGGKHHSLDPISTLYPNEIFSRSQKNRKLFKGVADSQLDQLRSIEMSPDSDIFNLLEGCRKKEKQLLIEGIIYGNGMLKINPRVYSYCEYFPDFGKSLFSTLGKAREFENNLESKIKKLFGVKPNSSELNDRVRNLYRKQVEEIVRKSLIVVDKLYCDAEDVEDEHNIYDDNVTTDYISGLMYEDEGKEVPEHYKYAKDLIDPKSESLVAKMQEKHVLILKKIEDEIVNLSKKITSTNFSAFLFLSTFKSLKENDIEFSLEDINGSTFRETLGSDIVPEQATEMKRIYSENQSVNAEVQKELVQNFMSRLGDGKTTFYTFTYNDHVQSFVAFTPKEDGSSYASAFNVAPEARGYKIGETMLHEVIDKEAREHILTADCDSKLPISSKYIETGWVAARYWDDHGDKILDIVRNDIERERYRGKQLNAEDIILGNVPEEILVKTAKEQKDLPFGLCNDGYVLTRMFRDQKTAQHYAVFESAPPAHRGSKTNADAFHK